MIIKGVSKITISAVLMLLLIVCTGCSRRLIIHPITENDIRVTDDGDICFSKWYFEEVLKAKLDMR